MRGAAIAEGDILVISIRKYMLCPEFISAFPDIIFARFCHGDFTKPDSCPPLPFP